MTMVSITPVPTRGDRVFYQAVSGEKRSQGSTPGEALDALSAQLSEEEAGTLVIVQNLRPDRFFTDAQQQRLKELMDRWRAARDRGENLPPDEQAELDVLADAEVRASGDRAAALADELGR
jgi:hypothetical protein